MEWVEEKLLFGLVKNKLTSMIRKSCLCFDWFCMKWKVEIFNTKKRFKWNGKNSATVKYLSSIPGKLFELLSDRSNWTGCLWMMHQGSSWWQRFSIQEKRRKQWYSVHWKLAGCSMLEGYWGKKQVNNCDHSQCPKLGIWDCCLEFALLLSDVQIILFLAFPMPFSVSRKRKSKNWEDEDFYDSDDDTFLDRTGAVEKKRLNRMKKAGKIEEKPETYDSLVRIIVMTCQLLSHACVILGLRRNLSGLWQWVTEMPEQDPFKSLENNSKLLDPQDTSQRNTSFCFKE